jgi:hypothetical protein
MKQFILELSDNFFVNVLLATTCFIGILCAIKYQSYILGSIAFIISQIKIEKLWQKN